MNKSKVILYVEGKTDETIVKEILTVAKYPLNQVNFVVTGGKRKMNNLLSELPPPESRQNEVQYAALIDLDSSTSYDAEQQAKQQLGNPPNVAVFCAVPSLEAWLFADIEAVKRHVESKHHQLLDRISLPEEIPYPKELATTIFGHRQQYEKSVLKMLSEIHIQLAASRSPSLRIFLAGMGQLLHVENIPVAHIYAHRSLEGDLFTNLLSEVLPAEAVIYRTMSGTNFTAKEMLRHIREGSSLGQQYAQDLLRVARDLLARKAQREAKL